jgi:hypothetical protein
MILLDFHFVFIGQRLPFLAVGIEQSIDRICQFGLAFHTANRRLSTLFLYLYQCICISKMAVQMKHIAPLDGRMPRLMPEHPLRV